MGAKSWVVGTMSWVAGRPTKNAKGIRGLEQLPEGSFWAGGGGGDGY